MLPVRAIEPDLLRCLRQGNRVVLRAPTGSGKTTQTPQMLHAAQLGTGRTIVLQPRRLATRLVARRVAQEMGVAVGALVGYQTRHEREVSRASRIVFMTEGLLLRMLQHDPQLPGVDVVVLDEFHERNLAGDLVLALLRQLQESHRPDLKLVVMSATLDVQRVADWLRCPALEASGRTFPVTINYQQRPTTAPIWTQAAECLATLPDEGDVLVFMPGAYEIRRTLDACRAMAPADTLLLPLHGALSPREQDLALAPASRRKVIVATNVAETSITIDGIRHVIDSGQARIHRYDPLRDLNVLRVLPISQASADQRAGRAGRTAPGECHRLWTAAEHARREAQTPPEVQRLELSSTLLLLHDLGWSDPLALPWLDVPETERLSRAGELLHRLGALDHDGALTEQGRLMAAFGEHPRVARLLIEASRRGCLARASNWAAIVSERDHRRPLPGAGSALSDLEVIEENEEPTREQQHVARQLRETAVRLRLNLAGQGDTVDLLKCLLAAYPDHLALLRDARQRHCFMPGRRRVLLDAQSRVAEEGLLLALEVREVGKGDSAQTTLSLASRIEPAWVEELYPEQLQQQVQHRWNAQQGVVECVTEQRLGDLPLTTAVRHETNPLHAGPVLAEQVLNGSLALEHWNENVTTWIERVRCVADWFPQRGLLTYSDEDLRVIVLEILGDAVRASQVRDRPCLPAIMGALSYDDQQFVERMAPTSLPLPGGKRMKLTYQRGSAPRGRAKIQELYDLTPPPTIAGGRVKVLLEILGPNYRPVQITDDLPGFWTGLYPQLKKELKRRYPKHEWR